MGLLLLAFTACSDDTNEWDPYYDWQARNEAWFQSVTDSASTAIAQAKAQYGDQWEDHCQWRRFKSLNMPQNYDSHKSTDSICVRIVSRGNGDYSPTWSDTIRVNFRGWMMPTTYRIYNDNNIEVDSLIQVAFDQSYYGPFNIETAAPQLFVVQGLVKGFSTAIQYMVEGDDWYVYVPCQLAYGEEAYGSIPAYSTLAWRINLVAAYPNNSGVPDWK